MTANGSNFLSGASVWWTAPGGSAASLPASFISAAQLQATIPGSLLTAVGTAQVAVLNLGSLLSSSQPFVLTSLPPGPAVTAVSVTPNSGLGSSGTFQLLYSDTLGAADLQTAWIWFTPSFGASAANTCMLYYNQAANQLNLLNDAGTAWTPATPGAGATLQNSQCSVNLSSTTVTPSGNNLTISLPLTFKAGFAGAKQVWMYAAGSTLNSGWQQLGSWTPH